MGDMKVGSTSPHVLAIESPGGGALTRAP